MKRARAYGGSGLGPTGRNVVVGLAVAMVVGMFVATMQHRGGRARAEASAVARAQSLSDTVLALELTAEDVARPVGDARYKDLSAVVTDRVLGADVVAVSILRRDGTVVFSSERDLLGVELTEERAALEHVFEGEVRSEVAAGASGEDLETLVPVRLKEGGPVEAVAQVIQDRAAILADASGPWPALQVGFGVVLLGCIVAVGLWVGRSGPAAANRGFAARPGGFAGGPQLSFDAGLLRQAEERARQAESAHKAVSEQLSRAQDAVREMDAAKHVAEERVRAVEERARAAEELTRSSEAALKTARERLGRLEDGLKEAEAAKDTLAAELERERVRPEPGEELRLALQRTLDLEAQVTAAEEKSTAIEQRAVRAEQRVRELDGMTQSAEVALRMANQKSAQLEARLKDAELGAKEAKERLGQTEAEKRSADERTRQSEEQRAEADARIEELRRRSSEAESERRRLEGELAQSVARLREMAERSQTAEAANRSLTEQLREALAAREEPRVIEVDEATAAGQAEADEEPTIVWEPSPERQFVQELRQLARDD
ncbi:MAG: hypothetical protein ACT4PO_12860 [Actinomycetota bacterium]